MVVAERKEGGFNLENLMGKDTLLIDVAMGNGDEYTLEEGYVGLLSHGQMVHVTGTLSDFLVQFSSLAGFRQQVAAATANGRFDIFGDEIIKSWRPVFLTPNRKITFTGAATATVYFQILAWKK